MIMAYDHLQDLTTGETRTCIVCRNYFEQINEENPNEKRCKSCQSKFRINQANQKYEQQKIANTVTA